MIRKNNILKINGSLPLFTKGWLPCVLFFMYFTPTNAQAIVVNAGPDQVICNSDTLFLSSLNAQISGLVNDGYWFTTGDGYFLPSFDDNVLFSIGTAYKPGPSDITNGGFDLLLVSLDPDGFGPLVQVTDMVHISLMGNIAMVCSSNLNIALGPDCTQTVDPTMLVANLIQPYHFYFVTIKDQFGHVIPNNLLTKDHIGKVLEYSVGHECGTNTCWGYLKVEDKLPPPLTCTNKTVLCGAYTQADSLGLPISAQATAKKTGPKSYRVINLDACSPVTLTYNDVYQPLLCETGLQAKLTRTWNAVDSFGNASSCFQVISIKNRTLEQVVLPFNFDDSEKPAFECGDTWPKTTQGYPSPDTTGMPGVTSCTNLAATYSDTKIDACGASYKIIRKWTLINWCGTIITEHNQLIKVKDSLAPIALCPNDTIIDASPYDCSSLYFKLPKPEILFECSSWFLQVSLKDAFTGLDASQFLTDGASGNPAVNALPLGDYLVYYYITDACGNIDTCYFSLAVVDRSVPTAICDQFTKVSLDAAGNARLFATTLDDGSLDNCAVVEYKIAKMVDSCAATAPLFKDYADFCCTESGKSVMVALRVTDFAGNSNTCMVEVQVQDKLPPQITCPPHLTISCRTVLDTANLSFLGNVVSSPALRKPITIYDEYNNGIVGYDGVYKDNCTGVITSKVKDLTQCYQGLLQRIFTVTDKSGNSSSCVQNIQISNPDPFDYYDITFPANKESNGCGVSNANPSQTGSPVFNNTKCANVAATYEDQVFTFTDGACVKIIRTWTVIDWCQFNANTGFGKWTGLQVLKFNNTIDPVFTAPCKDTLVCNYSESCGTTQYDFAPGTSDDCTADSLLKYEWKIDLNNNGTFDINGVIRYVKAPLPNGVHKVYYTVFDACGNQKSCEWLVTVKDCKKPTPHCISNLTTVIMPSSGQLTIKANSFDFNSYDNCTPPALLKYAFTEQVKDSLRVLTCADIPNGKEDTLDLNIWVFDLAGNKEYCAVHLTLTDNGNACPDAVTTSVLSGLVWQAATGDAVKNVKILATDPETGVYMEGITDNTGSYELDSVITGYSYKVKPSKNDSIKEGLSTLDVILIQRHILGANKFSDPLQIIAADMDGNKKVSVSDLVVLRKIILGSTTVMPGNRDCYTFVDDSYVFSNPTSPFNYPDYIITPSITEQHLSGLDFTAIKMGDVNNSLKNARNLDVTPRTSDPVFNIISENGRFILETNSDISLTGFQLMLNTSEYVDHLEVNPLLGEDLDWYATDRDLRLSYSPKDKVSLPKGTVLITGKTWVESESNLGFENEWYDVDLLSHKLDFEFKQPNKLEAEQLIIVPQGKNLRVYNPNEEDIINAHIIISDVAGRKISSLNWGVLVPGWNTIGIEGLSPQTLYFVSAEAAGLRAVAKWFFP
ncbi:MAG: hypothetical protein U0V54_03875 [Saprospiraceae bacterium]